MFSFFRRHNKHCHSLQYMQGSADARHDTACTSQKPGWHAVMRAAVILATVSAVVFSACGNQDAASAAASDKSAGSTLVVGVDNYPPFDYLDTDGMPSGIDVDLAREAFGRMGYNVEFKTINWEDKKKLVENGDIDCIWCCFTIDGRENDYRWAGPYMVSRQVVAVNPSSDIYSLKDLEGRRVAVQSTTKPETIFRNADGVNIPHVGKLISVPNRELIYIFLSKGYVDAVAAHDTAVEQFMHDYDLEYRILDEPLLKVGLGAAFALNDTRGIDVELGKVMKEMLEDGTTRKIISEHLSDPDRYLEVDYAKYQ